MKHSIQALLAAALCAATPLTAVAASDSPEKTYAASLFACHEGLLKLYYYPYLREFGEGGSSGSRVVKNRQNDELTDIILMPSEEPHGYWAYERSGDRYFFRTPPRKGDDLNDHYYRLQLGKRAVYINEELRIGMDQPLLQPTAFRDDHRDAYTTLRPAKLEESQFRDAVEGDIKTSLLSRACAHYTEEINAAGGEETYLQTRTASERAMRGTIAGLGSCEAFENADINRAAQRELLACGLRHSAPAGAEARTREAQLRDGKSAPPEGDRVPARDPDARRDVVRRLDP